MLLHSTKNQFRGLWVTTDLTTDARLFSKQLAHSLSIWQVENIKVVWLTVRKSLSSLIPVAIEHGFSFHHVNKDSLILTKRLIDNALIPEFANHTIGVGGVVTNTNNEVLVIVEKHDMVKNPGHLKFPGGMMDAGEFIEQAVKREIREETNVEADFLGIVGFRHFHKGQFGTSNIYLLCHLQATREEISPCPEEIGLAQWMDCDTYLTTESVSDFNKNILRAAMTNRYLRSQKMFSLIKIPPEDYEIYLSEMAPDS